jgi:elongation factor G
MVLKINILDTPGMDDLGGGVVSSLEVADLALMLINSSSGVESGTEAAGRHAEKNTPLMFVFNQLDHDKRQL